MADIEIRDDDGEKVDLDGGLLPVIQAIHTESHNGNLFQCTYYSSSVIISGTLEVFLKNVSTTKEYHCFFGHAAGGDALIELIENPTITANGTSLTLYNINRSSSLTSSGEAYHTPTLSGGTTLFTQLSPGGTGGTSIGATGETLERQLPSGNNYWFKVTNISGLSQPVSIWVTLYEKEEV